MAREDVDEFILKPMMATYDPPERLKFTPELGQDFEERKAEVLEPYYQALEHVPADTLVRTWERVRDTKSWFSWPTVAVFVQTARNLNKPPPTQEYSRRVQVRTEAYVKQWLDPKSRRAERKLFLKAKEEGWSAELLAYVQAAAEVQAQLIEGVPRERMYFSQDLVRDDPRFAEGRKGVTQYCEKVAKQIEKGTIKVQVTKSLQELWKQTAEGKTRSRAGSWEELIERAKSPKRPDDRRFSEPQVP